MNALYDNERSRQQSRRDVPAGHLPVHRWYLALAAPPPPPPPRDGLTVMRADPPTAAFYRFLYDNVGEQWLWGDRRRMDDIRLLATVADPAVQVQVAYLNGTPAGYFELDFRDDADNELAYFGLLPDFIGGGLGAHLLTLAILRAFAERDRRLIVNTCSLDHPRALANYCRRGFAIYREEDETCRDPRLDGLIPRAAGGHVPLAR